MQHPDHPDREREHGAGGEGEGGKEETGPKDWLSKLQIHPIINNSNYFKLSIKDNILLLLFLLSIFSPPPRRRNESQRELQTVEDEGKSSSCEAAGKTRINRIKDGSQLSLVLVSVFVCRL